MAAGWSRRSISCPLLDAVADLIEVAWCRPRYRYWVVSSLAMLDSSGEAPLLMQSGWTDALLMFNRELIRLAQRLEPV